MLNETKTQNLWGLIVIAFILSVLTYWVFRQVSTYYIVFEQSNRSVAVLLENQTKMMRSFAGQVADVKNDLARAEEKVVLVEQENQDLKSQLAALSDMVLLEQKISQLESANAQLQQSMDLALASAQARQNELDAKLKEYIAELDFNNIKDGKSILAKYRQKIREIKSRIKMFQVKDRQDEIASKKAADAARLALGNNGYLVRDGKRTSSDLVWPPPLEPKKMEIDVTFVK